MRPVIILLVSCSAILTAEGPCDMPADVAAAISTVERSRGSGAEIGEMREMMRTVVERHPSDVFANLEHLFLNMGYGHDDVIASYRRAMESHPGDRRYELFYAASLIGTNTPEAARRLGALGSDDFPYPFLLLGRIHSYDKFHDPALVSANLIRFVKVCPNYLPGYELLGYLGSGDELSAVAAGLRAVLDSRKDGDAVRAYRWLWNMEFRAAPPTEHARLRAAVAEDIQRLGLKDATDNDLAVETLRQAYRISGDTAAAAALPRRVDRRREPFEAQRKWNAEHPFPGESASADQKRDYYRALAVQAHATLARWPKEPVGYLDLLTALSKLPETPEAEVVAASERLLVFARARQEWFMDSPSLYVARAYTERGIRTGAVPGLIEAALREADVPTFPEYDLFADGNRRMNEERRFQRRIAVHAALFDWAVKNQKLEVARDALARMRPEVNAYVNSGLQPGPARWREADYWTKMAQLADLQGKAQDAADYRKTAELSKTASVRQNSPGDLASMEGKPFPPLRATALDGKTWTSADLDGKVAVINVWATWCGPCLEELPYFQRLYEALKDRPGVLVFSLNTDDNPGTVQPFLKARGLAFPTLLAHDYVEQALPSLGIPRTWLIRSGAIVFEEIGFQERESWVGRITAKVEKALSER